MQWTISVSCWWVSDNLLFITWYPNSQSNFTFKNEIKNIHNYHFKGMLYICVFLWTKLSFLKWELDFQSQCCLKKDSDYVNKDQSKHAFYFEKTESKVQKGSFVWSGNKSLCKSFQKYSPSWSIKVMRLMVVQISTRSIKCIPPEVSNAYHQMASKIR